MLTRVAKSLLPLPVIASNTSAAVISFRTSIQALEYSGRAHAATDAHRHHSITPVTPFQLAQNRRGQFCSSAPERMAQSNGATVDVYFIDVQAQRFNYCQGLGGKCFV